MLRRSLSWRGFLVVGYVGWALVCAFVLGGGGAVLLLFGVWGGVWLVFSGLWRRADETRRTLLHRRGYD